MNCEYCNTNFTPRQKYCSTKCRVYAHRDKYKMDSVEKGEIKKQVEETREREKRQLEDHFKKGIMNSEEAAQMEKEIKKL